MDLFMRVIMCGDEPMHTIYSTKEKALEVLDELRKKHYVGSGCSQIMTLRQYKDCHVWYFKKVTFDVIIDKPNENRACVCRAADGKCKYPNCKTGGKEALLEAQAEIQKLNLKIHGERIIRVDSMGGIDEKEEQPVVQVVDCNHKYEIGVVKGRKIAQCIHCLKTDVIMLKDLEDKPDPQTLVKHTVR